MFGNTVEAPVSGHPWETEKVSVTGAQALTGMMLLSSEFRQGFVKAVVSRAVCLPECLLEEKLFLMTLIFT